MHFGIFIDLYFFHVVLTARIQLSSHDLSEVRLIMSFAGFSMYG